MAIHGYDGLLAEMGREMLELRRRVAVLDDADQES
jgi:hypothetical protein